MSDTPSASCATNPARRACDTCGFDAHNSPCDKLKLTATIQDQMFAMLEDIQRENAKQSKILDEQADMFKAWNDTKGFVATMKNVGSLLVWVTITVGAIALILHNVKEYFIPVK